MTEIPKVFERPAELPIVTRRQEVERAYAAIVEEERRAVREKKTRVRSMRLVK